MNIPTSLIVVGLVVAWLVVLVPMIARRRERVPQAPASAGTRVLRRASASLRRKPRRAGAGRSAKRRERESGRTEEVLVSVGAGPQHEPMDAAEEWAAAQAATRHPVATMPPTTGDDPQLSFTDEDSGADSRADSDGVAVEAGGEFESVAESTVLMGISEPAGAEPADGQPVNNGTIPDEVDQDEWEIQSAAVPTVPTGATAPPRRPEDVDDEHLRPVPRRSGRGGYDPEAAEATRAYRYRQRRRITFVLLIATVVFSLFALLTVSVFWVAAALSVVLLAGYLTYLRRQVRIEAAIRQRRMERLQRARQIRPESGRSRPGQARSDADRNREVVDLDDDDPGFDDLEQYHEPVTYRRAVGQ